MTSDKEIAIVQKATIYDLIDIIESRPARTSRAIRRRKSRPW